MKCGKCVEEGLTSKLYTNGTVRTLMGFIPYYDEDGAFHSHDPNKSTSAYECSNGHKFTTVSVTPCRSCEYGHDPVVTIV